MIKSRLPALFAVWAAAADEPKSFLRREIMGGMTVGEMQSLEASVAWSRFCRRKDKTQTVALERSLASYFGIRFTLHFPAAMAEKSRLFDLRCPRTDAPHRLARSGLPPSFRSCAGIGDGRL